MTSSAHALRVVARRPTRTTFPFVPYVPLKELQPANPPTLAIPNTASRSVPSRTADTVFGDAAKESTRQVPRSGFRGAASKTRIVVSDPS